MIRNFGWTVSFRFVTNTRSRSYPDREVTLRSRANKLLILALLAARLCSAAPGYAAETSLSVLGLADEPSASAPAAPRAPRPTSKIAENITVVTADEIARLNAHTLADVLQAIPGIQLDYQRTPGTFSFFNIQGSFNNTVLVLVDGVRQNDFQLNTAQPGLIPVQQIERIEIVKGAASAAWGSALGGVINIVTKAPDGERPFGGLLSGSIGRRATADTRLEASGTAGRLGYYLTGGNLHSDGLRPNNGTDTDHFHGKLSWLDPAGGTLTAGYSYLGARRGQDEGLLWGAWPVRDDDSHHKKSGSLKYARPLADRLALDIEGHAFDRDEVTKLNDLVAGELVPFTHTQAVESGRGGSARLTWGDSRRNLVAGAEYGHAESRVQQIAPGSFAYFDKRWDHGAVFANGTLSVGDVTILPGVRYDHTGLSNEYASYTLGATWQATGKTLLRGYAARGFGLPDPRMQRDLMKVRTVQSGIETTDIPYLWLKGTWFYNRLREIESVGSDVLTNQDRQGFELEGRTVPFHGLSLTGGYTFTRVKDADTKVPLKTNSNQSVPTHVLKAGLLFDHAGFGLRGALTGNYLDWNADEGYPAHSRGMVVDLHLNWKVKPQAELSPELFFSGRNLFSNVQSVNTDIQVNTPRWFEGGARWRF